MIDSPLLWLFPTPTRSEEPLKQKSGGLSPSQLGLISQAGGASMEISAVALCVMDLSLLQSLPGAQNQTYGW